MKIVIGLLIDMIIWVLAVYFLHIINEYNFTSFIIGTICANISALIGYIISEEIDY